MFKRQDFNYADVNNKRVIKVYNSEYVITGRNMSHTNYDIGSKYYIHEIFRIQSNMFAYKPIFFSADIQNIILDGKYAAILSHGNISIVDLELAEKDFNDNFIVFTQNLYNSVINLLYFSDHTLYLYMPDFKFLHIANYKNQLARTFEIKDEIYELNNRYMITEDHETQKLYKTPSLENNSYKFLNDTNAYGILQMPDLVTYTENFKNEKSLLDLDHMAYNRLINNFDGLLSSDPRSRYKSLYIINNNDIMKDYIYWNEEVINIYIEYVYYDDGVLYIIYNEHGADRDNTIVSFKTQKAAMSY